ncbi:MAG TPA: hypothetical protein VFU46_14125 [Gemmatimonadales bacterium]|nr:hypothetical protein [Gemmatimonadales bacterium]
MVCILGGIGARAGRGAALLLVLFLQSIPPQHPADSFVSVQPAADDSRAVVTRYFETLLEPAIEGRLGGDGIARAIYREALSDQTRLRVGEEEFTAFWTALAARTRGALLRPAFSGTVHTALETEVPDQALVPVTVHVSALGFVLGLPLPALVGCAPIPDPRTPALGACRRELSALGLDARGNINALYRVHRENGRWKVVLHEGLVDEMNALAAGISVRRYTPDAELREGGLTIRVVDATMRSDRAELSLTVANGSGGEVALLNPLSLASLIDEQGTIYDTRLLRSRIPDAVPTGSTVSATVAFQPLPATVRKLTLVLPDFLLGGGPRTLRLPIALMPLPFASVERRPAPAEPALVHLLLLLRRIVVTDEQLAAVYRTLLGEETRAQISEAQFISYHRAEAADGWLCRLGFPYDVAFDSPEYDAARQEAVVRVRLPGPDGGAGAGVLLSYRLRRASGGWKADLPAEAIRHMAEWRPVDSRHVAVDVRGSEPGIRVEVRSVDLSRGRTRIVARITNERDQRIAITTEWAKLRDRWNRAYELREIQPSPDLVELILQQATARMLLDFAPLPVEARLVVLIIDPPAETNLSEVTVPIPLGCP